MLKLEHITKTYGQKVVLQTIDLAFKDQTGDTCFRNIGLGW